jgi:hypothetical protein
VAKPVVVQLGPDRLVSLKVIDWKAEQLEKENAMLEAQERAEDFAMEEK